MFILIWHKKMSLILLYNDPQYWIFRKINFEKWDKALWNYQKLQELQYLYSFFYLIPFTFFINFVKL